MSKPIIFPDGTKCHTGPTCKKHGALFKQLSNQTQQPNKQDLKVSKTISYLLRHHPEKAHLNIDREGFVDVDELIEKINLYVHAGEDVTRTQIEKIVAADNKQRYSIVGNRIRAVQGHSFPVDLRLQAKVPPVLLFHGTNAEAAKLIRKKGLLPMNREYVHLSPNEDTATNVGQRHKGDLVLLKIDTKAAYADGVKFFESENGVWLVKEIPPKYIK